MRDGSDMSLILGPCTCSPDHSRKKVHTVLQRPRGASRGAHPFAPSCSGARGDFTSLRQGRPARNSSLLTGDRHCVSLFLQGAGVFINGLANLALSVSGRRLYKPCSSLRLLYNDLYNDLCKPDCCGGDFQAVLQARRLSRIQKTAYCSNAVREETG